MVADVRLIVANPDEPNSGWHGEIPIFDMEGFTIKHLTRIVLSVLRIYMKYTQVIEYVVIVFKLLPIEISNGLPAQRQINNKIYGNKMVRLTLADCSVTTKWLSILFRLFFFCAFTEPIV